MMTKTKYYSLFNKKNQEYLKHPKCGLWFTTDKTEAQEMLDLCNKYLVEIDCEFLIPEIEICQHEKQKV